MTDRPDRDAAGRNSVVLADDHGLTRAGIRGLLAEIGGFEIVAEVGNGLEAISAIKRLQPDLAILDIKMPHSNGAEVFVEARRWSPGTRIVILTGISAAAMFRELVEAGVDGLFLKTGAARELAEALPRIMAGTPTIGAAAAALIRDSSASMRLTRRELQVLQAIARGESNPAIAARLGISPKTVDSHRTSLLAKLEVHSTAALVARALREGLLD